METDSSTGAAPASELRERSAKDRLQFAEAVARALDPVMASLGILFAIVVLAQTTMNLQGWASSALTILGWALWAVFVSEFVLRLVIAPSAAVFLKKNWWQVIFLALPFLRVLRIVRAARLARASRVVSSSLRATRGAGRVLGSRIAWLSAVTVIVIVGGSQLLYDLGAHPTYADAVYETALNAIGGQPTQEYTGIARLVVLALSTYSVIVFASLAAMLGAFFLGKNGGEPAAPAQERSEEGDQPTVV